MGRKHSHEVLLDEALRLAADEGLQAVTFGRVAQRAGVPDRTVVYYFPTKEALLQQVLERATHQFAEAIRSAFTGSASSPAVLAGRAWPVVSSAAAEPAFRLFFSALGLSAHDPRVTPVVRTLLSTWAATLEPAFRGSPERRRACAEATIALLDGLMVLRIAAGSEASDRAAKVLLGSRARRAQSAKP